MRKACRGEGLVERGKMGRIQWASSQSHSCWKHFENLQYLGLFKYLIKPDGPSSCGDNGKHLDSVYLWLMLPFLISDCEITDQAVSESFILFLC